MNWEKRFSEGSTPCLVGDVMFLFPIADDGFGNLIQRPTCYDIEWKYGWGSAPYGI